MIEIQVRKVKVTRGILDQMPVMHSLSNVQYENTVWAGWIYYNGSRHALIMLDGESVLLALGSIMYRVDANNPNRLLVGWNGETVLNHLYL
jgi:hypothetical protein